MSSASDGCA
jgi:hypothetical protein